MKTSLLFVKFFCKPAKAPEQQELMSEIQTAKRDMDQAFQNFEHAVDPSLIDSCIFDLNAAQMRYKYLMTRAKNLSLSSLEPDTLRYTESTVHF
jgi:exonuclease VII small subunit